MHFVSPFKRLQITITLHSLNSITLESFRKFFRKMRDYIKAYKGLLAGPVLAKLLSTKIIKRPMNIIDGTIY